MYFCPCYHSSTSTVKQQQEQQYHQRHENRNCNIKDNKFCVFKSVLLVAWLPTVAASATAAKNDDVTVIKSCLLVYHSIHPVLDISVFSTATEQPLWKHLLSLVLNRNNINTAYVYNYLLLCMLGDNCYFVCLFHRRLCFAYLTFWLLHLFVLHIDRLMTRQ